MFAVNNVKSTLIDFDLVSGLSKGREPIRRNLSKMAGIFYDRTAFDAEVGKDDKLVYEFYDMGVPETSGDVAYGTSITYPGKVGDEYHMTKGHFHTVLDTAEVAQLSLFDAPAPADPGADPASASPSAVPSSIPGAPAAPSANAAATRATRCRGRPPRGPRHERRRCTARSNRPR